ncbi:hypothetical protein EV363DRAFT_1454821 [Boletus edulis]|nr:hypothetical protein EV363DRAFT_1454821 [Boletus edulis]
MTVSTSFPHLVRSQSVEASMHRIPTPASDTIEITTRLDLSRMKSLYLVLPWLDALLEQEGTHSGAFVEDDVAPPTSPNTGDAEISDEKPDTDGASPLPEPELQLLLSF